jgi:hypothetical protein
MQVKSKSEPVCEALLSKLLDSLARREYINAYLGSTSPRASTSFPFLQKPIKLKFLRT